MKVRLVDVCTAKAASPACSTCHRAGAIVSPGPAGQAPQDGGGEEQQPEVAAAEQDAEEEHPAEQQLLVAASEGDAARVQQLLAGGAEPACETAEGVTPLMLAAGSGSEEAVLALLGAWWVDACRLHAGQGQC